MPTVEATEEAARSSLGWPFYHQATIDVNTSTHTDQTCKRSGAARTPFPVWLYVDLRKSQYPLGFLNPKDLNIPGPVAVAHTGDL